jgi:hypothetical protein
MNIEEGTSAGCQFPWPPPGSSMTENGQDLLGANNDSHCTRALAVEVRLLPGCSNLIPGEKFGTDPVVRMRFVGVTVGVSADGRVTPETFRQLTRSELHDQEPGVGIEPTTS